MFQRSMNETETLTDTPSFEIDTVIEARHEVAHEIDASFYDQAYFTDGTKSNYKPYGPGDWARRLSDMVVRNLAPDSVLDVGCAYGYIVKNLRDANVPAWGFDIDRKSTRLNSSH